MKYQIQKLKTIKKKKSGRDNQGHVSVRHQGGQQKRFLRLIDWKRDKFDIPSQVKSIEYDPNRSANIALLVYKDGEKRYILSPSGLKIGDIVISSDQAPIKPGNCLSLKNIPIGVPIHNLEYLPGKGGQLIRSAGASALTQSVEKDKAIVKLPSGEIRIFNSACKATVGTVGNTKHSSQKLTKAGQKRLRGIRPTVRGVAQHPDSHPHGGGEGKSGVGMKYPKTPWGKHALGKKTRKAKKHSNKYILKRIN
jgi:large subunit ribosomal protein L2